VGGGAARRRWEVARRPRVVPEGRATGGEGAVGSGGDAEGAPPAAGSGGEAGGRMKTGATETTRPTT
jgi:hypothetical protein